MMQSRQLKARHDQYVWFYENKKEGETHLDLTMDQKCLSQRQFDSYVSKYRGRGKSSQAERSRGVKAFRQECTGQTQNIVFWARVCCRCAHYETKPEKPIRLFKFDYKYGFAEDQTYSTQNSAERDSDVENIVFFLLGQYHCFFHWYVYNLFNEGLSFSAT